jgi:ERF superfamily
MPEPLPAEPCKTLAEALAALQARLPRVAKTADAQYGKYADLALISDALLPVLSSLGLSFSGKPTLNPEGKFVLHYTLRHVSGETDEGFYPLPSSGSPQQIGGAITYARRYTLCAVTGLTPNDDNEVLAADIHAEQQQLRQPVSAQDKERAKTSRLRAGTPRMARAQEEDPWAQDAPVDGDRAQELRQAIADGRAEDVPGSSNGKQHQQLGILYRQIGITERESRLADMTDRLGRVVTSAKDLSYAEAESAIRDLRELAKEQ